MFQQNFNLSKLHVVKKAKLQLFDCDKSQICNSKNLMQSL